MSGTCTGEGQSAQDILDIKNIDANAMKQTNQRFHVLQTYIKLIKNDSKMFIILQILKFFPSRILKMYSGFLKIIKQQNCFEH